MTAVQAAPQPNAHMPLNYQARQEMVKAPLQECCARAEIATYFQLSGLPLSAAESITMTLPPATAERASRAATTAYDMTSHHTMVTLKQGGAAVQIQLPGTVPIIANQLGVITATGARIPGLPPKVVNSPACCCAAILRAAFLVNGQLAEPGRGSPLTYTCPTHELAMAINGAIRRITNKGRIKETANGEFMVHHRERPSVFTILDTIGAPLAAMNWQNTWEHQREILLDKQRNPNNRDPLTSSNTNRAAIAAQLSAKKAELSLQILGDAVPSHLESTALLRMQHPTLTLTDLAAKSSPPTSKDAVAGKLRRLFAMADRHAEEHDLLKPSDITLDHTI